MGRIVQINSIRCLSNRYRLVILLKINDLIIKKIRIVIKIKIIIVKSWKKIIISYEGELEFCNEISQVLIFNKR